MAIARLHEDVVNRIAAGEVIHRPVSAVKELLENSIDAGSTSVVIRANAGGIKGLSIQDNGRGIQRADMDIVCERFTTSKLASFEDLRKIGTYGFRGEALASISHVAKVTITSKTEDQPCAFKASYADGKPVAPPKPCAGVRGTIIAVDDLFYNVSSRRRAVKNAGEEYARILDVVSSYAVHKGLAEADKGGEAKGVGFVCKKAGAATPDLHTSASDSKLDVIRAAFGANVANELLLVEQDARDFDFAAEQAAPDGPDAEPLVAAGATWRFSGYVSNANYHRKKNTSITFINDRLVKCASLKRALDALYAEFLPKGAHPFVYLAVYMPPAHVDVNVHPNKREVHFLHEEDIVNVIAQGVRERLAGANKSRVFYTQQTLTTEHELLSSQGSVQSAGGASETSSDPFAQAILGKRPRASQGTQGRASPRRREEDGAESVARTPARAPAKKRYEPHKLVRTDPKSKRLDSFFERASQAPPSVAPSMAASVAPSEGPGDPDDVPPADAPLAEREFISVKPGTFDDETSDESQQLASVRELIDAFEKRKSDKLKGMLDDLVFVGWVDACFCLVQVHTGLFIMDFVELCKEAVYQATLRGFGGFERIVLETPLPLARALELALEHRHKNKDVSSGFDPERARAKAAKLADFLCARASMLDEYFRINLDTEAGALRSLPEIIPGYVPDPVALPAFLLRICDQVEWFDEKGCFDSLAGELGSLYAQLPGLQARQETGADTWVHDKEDPRFVVKNVWLPWMRKHLVPYSEHADPANGVFRQIAALEVLYRIFERC